MSEKEILSVVAQLTNKISTDCDHISMALIKNCIESIIGPFTYICNKSLDSGIYPDKTKISKVIPVFTAGNKSKCNNYRPIALLKQSPFWWRSSRCRQCCSDFLLQCADDIEADHTDSGIAMDCADGNRKT